jgi:hypothetical protein
MMPVQDDLESIINALSLKRVICLKERVEMISEHIYHPLIEKYTRRVFDEKSAKDGREFL